MSDKLNQVDLAFVVDTTGSMGPFITAARQQMLDMLQALKSHAQIEIDLRVGVVEYRDHPPQEESFVFRMHPFVGRLQRAQETIDQLQPQGGGDAPEAVYDGLHAACDRLSWRSHSRRIALLIGDAPPHGFLPRGDTFRDGCPLGLTMDSTTARLEQKGIVLYALGLTQHVRESFATLAHHTGGEYFEASRGADAIEEIRTLLLDEFGDLEFDRQVLDLCTRNPGWTLDVICKSLETSRGRVSSSLSRLGRRYLLDR
jgi:Mg-chelatase subunit ChlD